MIARQEKGISLRLGRPELKRLAWLLVLSVFIHAAIWGGYELGQKFDVWNRLHWPAWLQQLAQKVAPKSPPLQPVEQQPPLMFVDVSPEQAVAVPPKNAKYYSGKNSVAANPDPVKDTDTPKINGTQEQVVKTEDADRHRFDKLMPAASAKPAEEERAKPKMAVGDLAFAKPDIARPDTGQAEQPRPRTLAEAEARRQATQMPGQKMQQDGGVRRQLNVASLDALATPFGAYDAAFIDAVQSRWYDLLDARNYAGYQQGRVVVRFRLKYDGTISDMEVVESTVDSINSYMCQQAVSDPSPYEQWPNDMRREIGSDYRTLTFTFYYN